MAKMNERISGKVFRGKKEGTKIGFPTANIKVAKAIESGIYAGYANLYENTLANLQALLYVPENNNNVIECHLLDFPKKDLYDTKISVQLLHKLRNVKKFSSLEEARKHIKKDEQKAKEWFKNNQS